MRTVTRVAIQIAVSAAFIGILLWRVNVGRLGSELASADWRWLAVAAPCFAASTFFGGLRWWLLVRRSGPVPLRAGVLTLFASMAVDLLLPLRAGTVALFQILHRRYSVPRAAVVGAAAAGGLVDIVATVALVIALWPLLALTSRSSIALILGVAIAVAAAAIGAIVLLRAKGPRRLLRWAPARVREGIARQIDFLLLGFLELGSVRTAFALIVLTFADWGAAAAGYMIVGMAFHLGAPWPLYLLLEAVGNLAGLVPLTEGNIGPYELILRELLTASGANGNRAAAFAVGAHAVSLLTTLVLAVISAVAVRLSPQEILFQAGNGNAESAPSPAESAPAHRSVDGNAPFIDPSSASDRSSSSPIPPQKRDRR